MLWQYSWRDLGTSRIVLRMALFTQLSLPYLSEDKTRAKWSAAMVFTFPLIMLKRVFLAYLIYISDGLTTSR